MLEIFCFTVDDVRLAVPLKVVDKVIRAVTVTPVPKAPPIFHGLIDYHGKIIPVINLRHRLKLSESDISPEQVFIIADTSLRQIAMVADSSEGVLISADEVFPAEYLNQQIEASGVLRTEDGMILIYDIEKFLLDEEIELLDEVIKTDIPN